MQSGVLARNTKLGQAILSTTVTAVMIPVCNSCFSSILCAEHHPSCSDTNVTAVHNQMSMQHHGQPANTMLLRLTSYMQNLMASPSFCSCSNCAKCSFQGQPATGSLMMEPLGSTPNRPSMASCTRALAGSQLCSAPTAHQPQYGINSYSCALAGDVLCSALTGLQA